MVACSGNSRVHLSPAQGKAFPLGRVFYGHPWRVDAYHGADTEAPGSPWLTRERLKPEVERGEVFEAGNVAEVGKCAKRLFFPS